MHLQFFNQINEIDPPKRFEGNSVSQPFRAHLIEIKMSISTPKSSLKWFISN